MRILLIGKSGQVGTALATLLPNLAGELIIVGRGECDLTNAEAIRATLRSVRPEVIVNAAAYTNVNGAETERDLAMVINAAAPGVMAEEVYRMNALLVHYSTDYVFDGSKQGEYLETDTPHPLNMYGGSKLEGERRIEGTGAKHVILRTSWVYGPTGNNFLRTILRLAAEREELAIVSDQVGAPTSSLQIAEGTIRILREWHKTGAGRVKSGVYHMTAAGETSWYGFACEFVDRMRDELPLKVKQIRPLLTAEYPSAAVRPLNSKLCNDKLEMACGVRLDSWQKGLREVLETLKVG